MSEALHEDDGLRLEQDGITIRRYYLPWAGPKRIHYAQIRKLRTEPMTWLSGKGRIWGATDPRYWFPLDTRRSSKRTPLILDIGGRLRPCITPDDPDRVIELLRGRVPVS